MLKRNLAARVFFRDQHLIRGGIEAGCAEEIELQLQAQQSLANPTGNLVVVRVSFPS